MTGARLALVVLVMLALGLPIAGLPEFAVFALAFLLIAFGSLRRGLGRWALALALLVIAAGGARLLAPPPIDQGFNVLVFESDPGPLQAGLPSDLLDQAIRPEVEAYLAKYPCDRTQPGCWRSYDTRPDRLHAFSSDGLLDATPGFSRKVRDIGFAEHAQLFAPAINRQRFNYYGVVDGKVRQGNNPDRERLPVFVTHRFPTSYEGSMVCWRGTLARPVPNGGPTEILGSSGEERCRVLDDLAGRPVFIAYGVDPNRPLAMRLDRSWPLAAWAVACRAGVLGAVLAALWLLVDRRRKRPLLVPALAFGGTALWAVGWDLGNASSAFLHGLAIYRGGADGLMHDALARDILLHVGAGDWKEALRGGESVFFFQPGLRYALALGKVLFGETHFFYLLVLALVPILVWRVTRLLLPAAWAMGLFLLFLFTPVFERFGFSQLNFVKEVYRGHAEPLGNGAMLGALACLLPLLRTAPKAAWAPFVGGLLLALAVAVRPNLAPSAAVIAAAAGAALIWRRDYTSLAALVLGASAIFLVLLHNLVFGGRFVPLSDVSTNPNNLKMTPKAYLDGAKALALLDFGSEAWRRMATQLQDWNAWTDFYRLPVAATAAYALLRRGSDPVLRAVAGAAIAQQALLLFYNAAGRYAYFAWMLCFLVFMVIFRENLWPQIRLHLERRRWQLPPRRA